MKLYSPDGVSELVAHPTKIDHFLAHGWTVEKKKKKAKKEFVAPVIEAVSEEPIEELDEIKEPE
jgi:hypothetical protein